MIMQVISMCSKMEMVNMSQHAMSKKKTGVVPGIF